MHEQVEVVHENGVFRPLGPIPGQIHENQHFTVTIESTNKTKNWLADADPTVTLETVRAAMAKIPGTLAQAVYAEREER